MKRHYYIPDKRLSSNSMRKEKNKQLDFKSEGNIAFACLIITLIFIICKFIHNLYN